MSWTVLNTNPRTGANTAPKKAEKNVATIMTGGSWATISRVLTIKRVCRQRSRRCIKIIQFAGCKLFNTCQYPMFVQLQIDTESRAQSQSVLMWHIQHWHSIQGQCHHRPLCQSWPPPPPPWPSWPPGTMLWADRGNVLSSSLSSANCEHWMVTWQGADITPARFDICNQSERK